MTSELQLAGVPIANLRKGDRFTEAQVFHTMRVMDPKLDSKMKRYEAGEIKDPRSFLAVTLKLRIERIRLEMGSPVVCRTRDYGLQVLTDAEAVKYLDSQANAGLRKHRAKTQQMFNSIDVNELTTHERSELESRQRRQAFVLAAQQGARTQSLRMQRKGLTLPKYGEVPTEK